MSRHPLTPDYADELVTAMALTPSPELVTIELARLTQTSTEWERRFKTYDRLQDAGLSCEEAARIACADMEPEPETERKAA